MKRLNLFLLNFIFVLKILSQDASFIATIDNANPQVGEPISLNFTLNNAGVGGGKNFRAPDLNNFIILSGPNQSTSMQFINGTVSSTFTISFDIQPKNDGKFTIAAATIEAGGHQYSSNKIDVNVSRSAQKQNLPQQQNSANENIFLRGSLDRNNIFIGEQINIVYKVYTRLRINNYAINAFPTTQGFWAEEFPQNQQVKLTTEVVNGVQYQVGELKRIALFPTQSGNLEIKPFEITCQVQVPSKRRSNDPFDVFNDPFFNSVQIQNVQIKSQLIKINVKPLPNLNVPKSFSGAVGSYDLNISSNKKEYETNEAISLKMKISGKGNIRLIETPKIELSNEFELYPPKLNDNVDLMSNNISGSRTFEWLVIPRFEGNKKIPSFEWSYFNPQINKYVTINSKEITLKILQGKNSFRKENNNLAKEEIELLNQDIRFIKIKNSSFDKIGKSEVSFISRIILYLLPFIVAIGFIIIKTNQEKVKIDIKGFKSRRALKLAKSKLKFAEKYLNSDDAKFLEELSKVLTEYICNKLKINYSDFNIETIKNKLILANVNEEVIKLYTDLLQRCDQVRFSQNKDLKIIKKDLFDSSTSIILKMEEIL